MPNVNMPLRLSSEPK
uniref:Uncharacterized protein n=1 Tax=Anguilla anguilla TaxID=7936 RepID=A0A0E9RAG9_ANGAN